MAHTRTRRSPEQLIQDLEAKLTALRTKSEREKLKRDPTSKHISAAIRSIDKAMESCSYAATTRALDDARATLSACVSLDGGVPSSAPERTRKQRASGGQIEPDMLLAFVRANPSQRGEQIASALGTDAATIRPTMKQLIADRKIKTKGERRGMTYAAV